jgi:CBS-domain-containing membrane protein
MTIQERSGGVARVTQLTAGDLLNGEVVVLRSAATMHQAAHKFSECSIGLAPVVDDAGHCIGVLSARDFVTYEIDRTGEETPPDGKPCNKAARGDFLPWNSVRKFMSTAVQTTAFDTPLLRLSEIMLAEHIHHLVVLDERSAPIGIVSTLDVLSALVAIIYEQKSLEVHRS